MVYTLLIHSNSHSIHMISF